MRPNHGVVVIVVVLSVLGALAPAAAPPETAVSTAGSPAPGEPSATDEPPATGQPSASGQPRQAGDAACDFVELYNETIPSVVLVRRSGGQGSGFAFRVHDDGTGYFVTNRHVLGDAERVRVRFRRGEVRTGTVVGTERAADLGVVRVNRTPDYVEALPVAASSPQPGRRVAALGHPFGLRGTITQGIVSNVDRSVRTERGFVIPDAVQTDAAINPGNSGGPLVTCAGTVVGVNTAAAPAGRAENIGFAVSAALVERVVPELIATGEFAYPYLGVRTADVTPAVARANDLAAARGVMVVETAAGGPADGELRPADRTAVVDGRRVPVGGDVIVAIDGRPVERAEDLSSYLATEASPGDEVVLTVRRDGARRNVTVTLGERPEAPAA